MPKGQVYINSLDAYETWGISFDTSSLSALMTPPSLKEWVFNEIRTENGTRYLQTNIPKVASRNVTLTFNLTANSEDEFLHRYEAFCEVLAEGRIDLTTSYQRGVVYHFLYEKCLQFTQFNRSIATFGLQLIEPDPTNRS